MQLEGKKIIYCGIGRGIGYWVAKGLLKEGASLVGLGRTQLSEEKFAEFNSLGPGRFAFYTCDVTDRARVDECVDAAVKKMGGLDVVINGSTVYWDVKAEDASHDAFKTHFENIFFGTVNLNQSAFRYLKNTGGRILNFGSGAGITTKTVGSDPAPYSAAKAAVHMWTRTIAKEWAQYGITANAICPFMHTELTDEGINTPELVAWYKERCKLQTLLGRDGDVTKEIAPYIIFLCSDGANYVTGQLINIDGGMVENR